MTETFIRLRSLQGLDDELRLLTSKARDIPERIKRLSDEAEGARRELEETEQALTEHKKDYKLADIEIKAADEKISQYSVQLYSAKTNEQYKAFLKEIEAQKKLKAGVEDRMLALLEESEQLEQKRRIAATDATQYSTDNTRKIGALESEKSELDAAIAERETGRTELLESLDRTVRRLYDRIHAKKKGIAVARVAGARCNGCYNPIPPQRMIEIAREKRIYTCEACGRILVPDQK